MNTHCKNCGKLIVDKRGGAKFCCDTCKSEYHNKYRLSGLNGIDPATLTLKKEPVKENPAPEIKPVLPETDKIPTPQKQTVSVDAETFKELQEAELPPLKNVIIVEGDQDQVGEDLAGEKEENLEPVTPLPEKYINQTTKVENPSYKPAQDRHQENLKVKDALKKQLEELQNELSRQLSRNGNEFLAIGGVGAGLLGFCSFPESSNDEPPSGNYLKDKDGKIISSFQKGRWLKHLKAKKTETPSVWARLVRAALFGAAGTGAGFLLKAGTQDWREKDKQQKIAAIQAQIVETQKNIQLMNTKIAGSASALLVTSEYLKKTQQVVNPAYEQALSGLSAKARAQNKQTNEEQKNKSGSPIFKSDKIVKATELARRQYKALDFGGLWEEFFGQPQINFKALIHGNSGEGKSTFCLWFARYLAENFGRVLYVSGEEGCNKTFHDKLKNCKADVANLYILDVRTGEDFMKEVRPNEFHFIILDSLHDMEIDARKLKVIFEHYKKSAFVCIDQNNKKGELLGANEKKHIVDIVVNVKNYTAETTKNRFKSRGVITKTADFAGPTGAKIIPLNDNKRAAKEDDLDADRRGVIED